MISGGMSSLPVRLRASTKGGNEFDPFSRLATRVRILFSIPAVRRMVVAPHKSDMRMDMRVIWAHAQKDRPRAPI